MSNKKQNDPSRREAETQQTRKADRNDTPAGQSAEQETQRPAATIEAFLPTDYFSSDIAAQAAKRRRRLALFATIVVLVAAITTAGLVYYRRLRQNPSDFFANAPNTPAPTPTAASNNAAPAPNVTSTPTPDPFSVLEQPSELVLPQNVVNVMLIGADYAEERESWHGKDGLTAAHADVMIVLAINFDENRADLISLPRDTYTLVPGVSGIYKLNASLDCGGGLLAENGAGFLKVCETASYLLGGIPVNYYYAVTMPAVKQLVDAIGGVDFNLDISFTMQGRTYYEGRQHMNGQAVLDYLRVRKEASGLKPSERGDAQRVKRQKKMLIAIFNQLKEKDMMVKVPDILSAFDGQLFTNCTTSQTAALALYGYNMPSENIGMHSMVGHMRSMYSWNFNFINQSKRVDLIREIYGVDVPKIYEISENYAAKVHQNKIANQYINTCGPLTKYVAALIAADDLLPEFTASPTPSPETTPEASVSPAPETPVPTASATPSPVTPPPDAGGEGVPGGAAGMRFDLADTAAALSTHRSSVLTEETRKYSPTQRNIYQKYLEALDTCRDLRGGDTDKLASACTKLRSAAERCASTFGYSGKLNWTIPPLANTNEIYVDFR